MAGAIFWVKDMILGMCNGGQMLYRDYISAALIHHQTAYKWQCLHINSLHMSSSLSIHKLLSVGLIDIFLIILLSCENKCYHVKNIEIFMKGAFLGAT